MKKNMIICWILILCSSCVQDESEIYIDSEILPYFEKFAQEASSRGVEVDFTTAEVEGFIKSLTDKNIKGQCIHDNVAPDKVLIDKTFWATSDENSREFIIFHELGHCILDRVHLDDTDDDGICISIMHSGDITCRKNYHDLTRKQYLDELFGY